MLILPSERMYDGWSPVEEFRTARPVPCASALMSLAPSAAEALEAEARKMSMGGAAEVKPGAGAIPVAARSSFTPIPPA